MTNPLTGGSHSRPRAISLAATKGQFARYLVVGLGNTVLSFTTYRLLLAIDMPYPLAALLAFAVGALNGYILNRRWTFAAQDTMRARVVYIGVAATAALAMSGLVVLFVRAVGAGHVVAYLAALPPVTVCTFAALRLWTFGDDRA